MGSVLELEEKQMTRHRLFLTLYATLALVVGFLAFGQSPALSVECVVCERSFADCRQPPRRRKW